MPLFIIFISGNSKNKDRDRDAGDSRGPEKIVWEFTPGQQQQQQQQPTAAAMVNSSGVFKDKSRWIALIKTDSGNNNSNSNSNNNVTFLGRFDTEEEALGAHKRVSRIE